MTQTLLATAEVVIIAAFIQVPNGACTEVFLHKVAVPGRDKKSGPPPKRRGDGGSGPERGYPASQLWSSKSLLRILCRAVCAQERLRHTRDAGLLAGPEMRSGMEHQPAHAEAAAAGQLVGERLD